MGDAATLQVDYLDLVIQHTPTRPLDCFAGAVGRWNFEKCGTWTHDIDPGDAGRQDGWRALEVAQKQGLVRAIGVSDYSVSQLNAIVEIATVIPAVLQTPLSPATHDAQMARFCAEHGIIRQVTAPRR